MAQAQTGCSFPILGDIQKASGHGPGQQAVGGTARVQELNEITSRNAFQPQPSGDPLVMLENFSVEIIDLWLFLI